MNSGATMRVSGGMQLQDGIEKPHRAMYQRSPVFKADIRLRHRAKVRKAGKHFVVVTDKDTVEALCARTSRLAR